MKKKKLIILLSIIILLIVSIFIGLNIYVDSIISRVEEGETIHTEDAEIAQEVLEREEVKDIENIALFGVDNSGAKYNEERSDAMKIISLNKTDKTIAITSVERDVVVYIPGEYQKYGHFNWAYWFGGPKLAVQTLNYNLDLDITKYVTFTFGAVEDLVDLLGGIDVELTGNEAATVGIGSYAGTYTLNGKQALSYSRIRKLDSDFTRMERQNYVIQAVMNKLKNQDILTIMNIVNEMLPSINTNLTVNEIKDYITSLLSYDLGNIEQYKEPSGEYNDIETCPGLGGYIVRSYSGMVENLHKNIYKVDSYEVSKRVKDNEERIYSTYGEFTKE
ncbi:MAG: LCP family protein [Erysipelotrichaceae bacterium]